MLLLLLDGLSVPTRIFLTNDIWRLCSSFTISICSLTDTTALIWVYLANLFDSCMLPWRWWSLLQPALVNTSPCLYKSRDYSRTTGISYSPKAVAFTGLVFWPRKAIVIMGLVVPFNLSSYCAFIQLTLWPRKHCAVCPVPSRRAVSSNTGYFVHQSNLDLKLKAVSLG